MNVGAIFSAVAPLLQGQQHHEEALGLGMDLHRRSLALAHSQQQQELTLSAILHKRDLALEEELYAGQMQHDLELARREAERDVWSQRNQHIQTLMVVGTLIFTCVYALIAQGDPPQGTNVWLLRFFALSEGLALSFQFISIWFCLNVQLRMSQYDLHNRTTLYCCGGQHLDFNDYYKCHCQHIERYAFFMFYLGTGATVGAAGLFCYSKFFFEYHALAAAVVALIMALVAMFIPAITSLVDKFIVFRQQRKQQKLHPDAEQEDDDNAVGDDYNDYKYNTFTSNFEMESYVDDASVVKQAPTGASDNEANVDGAGEGPTPNSDDVPPLAAFEPVKGSCTARDSASSKRQVREPAGEIGGRSYPTTRNAPDNSNDYDTYSKTYTYKNYKDGMFDGGDQMDCGEAGNFKSLLPSRANSGLYRQPSNPVRLARSLSSDDVSDVSATTMATNTDMHYTPSAHPSPSRKRRSSLFDKNEIKLSGANTDEETMKMIIDALSLYPPGRKDHISVTPASHLVSRTSSINQESSANEARSYPPFLGRPGGSRPVDSLKGADSFPSSIIPLDSERYNQLMGDGCIQSTDVLRRVMASVSNQGQTNKTSPGRVARNKNTRT